MRLGLMTRRIEKLCQVAHSGRFMLALVRHHVLAASEHRRVLEAGFSTVVDIGANRGQFSLAVREYSPKASVVAFEPLAGPADQFKRLFAHDNQVTLHQAAIGPREETATIYVAQADDSSSLLPMSDVQCGLFPGMRTAGTESVQVARLTSFIAEDEVRSPALLKLDVQGFELEALRGSEELVGQFDDILVECSFLELYVGQALVDEVICFLKGRGFGLVNAYSMEYDQHGQAIQGDFLFRRGSAP